MTLFNPQPLRDLNESMRRAWRRCLETAEPVMILSVFEAKLRFRVSVVLIANRCKVVALFRQVFVGELAENTLGSRPACSMLRLRLGSRALRSIGEQAPS